jgi:uncharacterized protein YbjT (DUF2867 family)
MWCPACHVHSHDSDPRRHRQDGAPHPERLRAAGATVRTAARRDADVRFDWDDVTTHDAALRGVSAVYLVPPTLRTDFGPRAVELHLAAADDLGHAIVRPGWFMHSFSEGYFRPSADGSIFAPAGDGAEAFVHVDDIAEVAAATLLDPAAHAGAGYTLTGPAALTFAQVAERIAAASGRRIAYVDVSVEEWVAREVAGGMPEDYAGLLAMLLDEGLRVGAGAAVTDDVERVTGHAPRSLDEYVAEAWARPAA